MVSSGAPDRSWTGRPVVGDDVVTADGDLAFRRINDAADDGDERGLARAVRSEQGEDFGLADLEVDVLEGMKPAGIGLGKTLTDIIVSRVAS